MPEGRHFVLPLQGNAREVWVGFEALKLMTTQNYESPSLNWSVGKEINSMAIRNPFSLVYYAAL